MKLATRPGLGRFAGDEHALQDLLDKRRHLTRNPIRRHLPDLVERGVLDQLHDPLLGELFGGCRSRPLRIVGWFGTAKWW
jgi:hypothetical protein